ncbi:uncharacterized protein [Solanum lycopersicum]|uniref:uncharacterized protein n=1 Tax=Solanum lycopersicum TaxID=4081 RepID=UPI0037478DB5
MEECKSRDGDSRRVYDSDDEMWAENRSKRLHDPLLMKNNNGMNYVIKKIPAHPLRLGATFNFDFVNKIKLSIKDEGVALFKKIIFGPYLEIPKCNFQGQITKCLLLLEVRHENRDVLHVRHTNGNVLVFGMKEFAIVTGLKCKGNVREFSYPNSTQSRLLQKYFPDCPTVITKSRLIQRFAMGNWETTQESVEMAILYFINTFLLCHLGETFISIEEFLMVEDGRYEMYPWGQIAFNKLITSLSPDLAVKVANGIPRICNCTVVAEKPKYEKLMTSIFSENTCSNIALTQDEVESLDLPDSQEVNRNEVSTPPVGAKKVHTKDKSGFEDFSTSPPDHLLRRSSRVSDTSSPPPPKRRKNTDTHKTKGLKTLSKQSKPQLNQSFSMPAEEHTPPANVSSAHVSSQVSKDKSVYPDIEELKQHMKEYVDNKFEYLVNLIKANHIKVMNSKNREDGQQSKVIMLQINLMKDMGGKSTPHMVEVSDEESNDGHQATSPIQMELDVDNQTEDTLKNHQVMKDVLELQSPNSDSHHTDDTCEHSKDAPSAQTPHHLFEGTMNEDISDSTPSGSISPDTREAMNTLIADLGSLPTNANQQEFTKNQCLLSDSQLPIDIPITDIVVRSEINTPHARIRMPSRN